MKNKGTKEEMKGGIMWRKMIRAVGLVVKDSSVQRIYEDKWRNCHV